MSYIWIVATAIFFIAAFAVSMGVAAAVERLGAWIFASRSGGGGGMGPWRWRPTPPPPRPHGSLGADAPARRPPRVGSRG
jgi:hypothetical protein